MVLKRWEEMKGWILSWNDFVCFIDSVGIRTVLNWNSVRLQVIKYLMSTHQVSSIVLGISINYRRVG